jgi:hypothetical protein
MARYIKPKFEPKDLGTNPFRTSLEIKVRSYKTGKYTKDEEGIIDYDYTDIEYERYCKVYTAPENRLIVNEFSNKAAHLFLWLQYILTTGEEYFCFNRERYMEEKRIKSITTVSDAITELVRYGIIQWTTIKDVYWINPAMFYSGNRVAKYKENVVQVYEN